MFNPLDFGATGNGIADDILPLQQTVNTARVASERGGAVLIASSKAFGISQPLILPRTGATPAGAVKLVGKDRYTSIIKALPNFPPGRALIEWEDSISRTWEQSIANLCLELPDVAGVRAIHYHIHSSTNYNAISAEKLQIALDNLYIRGNNEFHAEFIRLEGMVVQSVITNIYGDPKQGAGTYDTLLLHVDSQYGDMIPANDIDGPGLFQSTIENLTTMIRRGGYTAAFRGRLMQSRFGNVFANGGKNTPSFEFLGCVNSNIHNLGTEGQGEKPQYRFHRCEFNQIHNISIGTPDAIDSSGVGNGIELTECIGNHFAHRQTWKSKPAFSSKGVKVVTIDALSRLNVFDNFAIRSAAGDPTAELSILAETARGNRINYIDTYNDSYATGILTGA